MHSKLCCLQGGKGIVHFALKLALEFHREENANLNFFGSLRGFKLEKPPPNA